MKTGVTKITATKNGIITAVTGTGALGDFNILGAATVIAEGNRFSDQADLRDIAQKWAEFARNAFATEAKNNRKNIVANEIKKRKNGSKGTYVDAVFVGFDKNGNELLCAVEVDMENSQGQIHPFIKEIKDADVLQRTQRDIVPRGYAVETYDELRKRESTRSLNNQDVLRGFASPNEQVEICAAVKFTALAGEWHSELVGGRTLVAVVHRGSVAWPSPPATCSNH